MKGRNALAVVTAVSLSFPVVASSTAYAFDAGGFAGGILGGMIGSAMVRAQPRPVIIYRPRPVYSVVVPRHVVVQRHYAAAPRPSHAATPAASTAAVVNPAADPFATAKPTRPTPNPVANKP